MKTIHLAASMILTALLALLALPKAIGLTMLYYIESLPRAQFGDGPPADVKALHEATEKAFKAMQENIAKVQDTAMKALEEVRTEGTLHKKTSDALTELGKTGNELSEGVKSLRDRLTEVEQKLVKGPAGNDRAEIKTAGQVLIESDEYKAMVKSGSRNSQAVSIERKTIVNATYNTSQPLVNGDRLGGIVVAPEQRLTIRDLLPQIPTSSNLIEFGRELVFTNNAGPQGGTSPIGNGEGEPKVESNITFELATQAVTTLAHWLGASRQVLSDAPQLAGYIDTRLSYGLKLEEEDELLNSDGAAGQLSGLNLGATQFSGGVTNQTTLDTLLKAFLQVSLSFYEATGVVLHPTDWTTLQLAKDTTGRYLFSDPQAMTQPRVWGKPVVSTPSQTVGTFLTGAFNLGAAIYDREAMTIRISDQHQDYFIRNLVAILCEERLALVIYRSQAFVKGSISFAG